LQRSRFAEVTSRLSTASPKMEPLDSDRARTVTIAVVSPHADPTPAISAALRDATATLDAADATLSTVADQPARSGLLGSWPPTARNAIVYLWYAIIATIAVAEVNHVGGDSGQAGLATATAAIAAPIAAWVVAWLSVSILFAPDANGKRRRSTWLGAGICLIPLLIGLILAGR
jgi:hypothetical protein